MLGIETLLVIGGKILDKVLPDPKAKAEAQLELLRLQQSGQLAEMDHELKLTLAQTDINREEAKNPSIFVSGWRPFVGWICGVGLGYQFLVMPLVSWYAVNHAMQTPPSLDMGTLITLLGGMLGLGGLRTFEKYQGVARVR
jgi:hypothetical protein